MINFSCCYGKSRKRNVAMFCATIVQKSFADKKERNVDTKSSTIFFSLNIYLNDKEKVSTWKRFDFTNIFQKNLHTQEHIDVVNRYNIRYISFISSLTTATFMLLPRSLSLIESGNVKLAQNLLEMTSALWLL